MEAEAALDAIRVRRAAVGSEITAISMSNTSRADMLRAKLRASASASIDSLNSWARDEERKARALAMTRQEQGDGDKYDLVHLKPIVKVFTNRGSIEKRLQTLREIMRQCREVLPFLAISDGDLEARIKALRETVPSSDKLEPVASVLAS
jgi:hypothetical protein